MTSVIATIATTLAASATRRRESSPSRNTPSSEPNGTPAILNTSQRICWRQPRNTQAMMPSTTPKTTTHARDTRR